MVVAPRLIAHLRMPTTSPDDHRDFRLNAALRAPLIMGWHMASGELVSGNVVADADAKGHKTDQLKERKHPTRKKSLAKKTRARGPGPRTANLLAQFSPSLYEFSVGRTHNHAQIYCGCYRKLFAVGGSGYRYRSIALASFSRRFRSGAHPLEWIFGGEHRILRRDLHLLRVGLRPPFSPERITCRSLVLHPRRGDGDCGHDSQLE
jgi:hypothetical protein